MRLRTTLYVVIGTLVAASLVFFSSSLVAGPATGLSGMIAAQRQMPVLWLWDVVALGIVAMMWWLAVISDHFQGFADHQAAQHQEQLDEMIGRTLELEQNNDSYADQIESLEAEIRRRFSDLADQIAALENVAESRRTVFEMEARRIAETANRALQTQVDSNTDKVDAVTASLQFQRGELRRLRQQVHELQLAMPGLEALRLSPPKIYTTGATAHEGTDLTAAKPSTLATPEAAHPDGHDESEGAIELREPDCESRNGRLNGSHKPAEDFAEAGALDAQSADLPPVDAQPMANGQTSGTGSPSWAEGPVAGANGTPTAFAAVSGKRLKSQNGSRSVSPEAAVMNGNAQESTEADEASWLSRTAEANG